MRPASTSCICLRLYWLDALFVFPALFRHFLYFAGTFQIRHHLFCLQVPHATADHSGSRPGRYMEIAVDQCSGSIDDLALFDLILASMIGHPLYLTRSRLPHILCSPTSKNGRMNFEPGTPTTHGRAESAQLLKRNPKQKIQFEAKALYTW